MRKKSNPIVTGASRGIRRGIIRVAAAGYDIAFSIGHGEDEAKEAAEIRNMGSFAWYAKGLI